MTYVVQPNNAIAKRIKIVLPPIVQVDVREYGNEVANWVVIFSSS